MDELEGTLSNLHTVALTNGKTGCTIHQLLKDHNDLYGELNFRKLGFASLEALLRSRSDLFYMANGKWFGRVTEETAQVHAELMKGGNKNNRSRGGGGGGRPRGGGRGAASSFGAAFAPQRGGSWKGGLAPRGGSFQSSSFSRGGSAFGGASSGASRQGVFGGGRGGGGGGSGFNAPPRFDNVPVADRRVPPASSNYGSGGYGEKRGSGSSGYGGDGFSGSGGYGQRAYDRRDDDRDGGFADERDYEERRDDRDRRDDERARYDEDRDRDGRGGYGGAYPEDRNGGSFGQGNDYDRPAAPAYQDDYRNRADAPHDRHLDDERDRYKDRRSPMRANEREYVEDQKPAPVPSEPPRSGVFATRSSSATVPTPPPPPQSTSATSSKGKEVSEVVLAWDGPPGQANNYDDPPGIAKPEPFQPFPVQNSLPLDMPPPGFEHMVRGGGFPKAQPVSSTVPARSTPTPSANGSIGERAAPPKTDTVAGEQPKKTSVTRGELMEWVLNLFNNSAKRRAMGELLVELEKLDRKRLGAMTGRKFDEESLLQFLQQNLQKQPRLWMKEEDGQYFLYANGPCADNSETCSVDGRDERDKKIQLADSWWKFYERLYVVACNCPDMKLPTDDHSIGWAGEVKKEFHRAVDVKLKGIGRCFVNEFHPTTSVMALNERPSDEIYQEALATTPNIFYEFPPPPLPPTSLRSLAPAVSLAAPPGFRSTAAAGFASSSGIPSGSAPTAVRSPSPIVVDSREASMVTRDMTNLRVTSTSFDRPPAVNRFEEPPISAPPPTVPRILTHTFRHHLDSIPETDLYSRYGQGGIMCQPIKLIDLAAFFVRLEEDDQLLEKMEREMSYSWKVPPPGLFDWRLGDAALLKEGNRFHRVSVVDEESRGKVYVRFVDIGTQDEVPVDMLWPLEERFLTSALVIRMAVRGFTIMDQVGYDEMVDSLDATLRNEKFTLEIKEIEGRRADGAIVARFVYHGPENDVRIPEYFRDAGVIRYAF